MYMIVSITVLKKIQEKPISGIYPRFFIIGSRVIITLVVSKNIIVIEALIMIFFIAS